MKVGDVVRYRNGSGWWMTVEALDGKSVSLVWFQRDSVGNWTGPHRGTVSKAYVEVCSQDEGHGTAVRR